ncbi:hypothetical protein AAAX36_04655, partial [Collinsella sp. CLA-ER-H10]
MTNSLSAFSLLEAREDCELCLVGGMYRRRTAAFMGPMAEDTLRALGIDTAFIGANGILDGDVSTSNMDEGRIQQLAFSKADARYLIADSSRIGRRYFCPITVEIVSPGPSRATIEARPERAADRAPAHGRTSLPPRGPVG